MSAKEDLLPKEISTIEKLFKALKKLVAKEFIFLLLFLIIAFPIAMLIAFIMANFSNERTIVSMKEIMGTGDASGGRYSFVIIYGFSLAGLYFSKLTYGALKTLTKPEDS